MEPYYILRLVLGTALALYLARHGLKRNSLSYSGAIAAFFVGFVSFVTSYRFGILLILFYYTSSKLTKVNEAKKSRLEDHFKKGGQRNAVQVLANSALATLLCLLYMRVVGEDKHVWFSTSRLGSTEFLFKEHLGGLIWCMYVAHYACAAGDTWASELGVLATAQPRLVTTLFLRPVPPGTNGGMSLLGTAASAAGGLFIGLLFVVMAQFVHPALPASQLPMALVGLLSGVLGSLLDSILGATLQASYFSHKKKKIVKSLDSQDPSIEHICGVDVLSNEGVNAISIGLTMLAATVIGPRIFCLCDPDNHC